jgi:hypothetical protein
MAIVYRYGWRAATAPPKAALMELVSNDAWLGLLRALSSTKQLAIQT